MTRETDRGTEARHADHARLARQVLAPLIEEADERNADSAWTPDRARDNWHQIDAKLRRRRGAVPVVWLGGALSAATAVALFLSVRAPDEDRTRAESPAPMAPMLLATGARVVGSGTLPSGATVAATGPDEVDVLVARASADHSRLILRRGGLVSEVPKLGSGQTYVVETDLVRVEVRGTRFIVEVVEPGERTRVEVEEGVVVVTPVDGRPPLTLFAGGSTEIGAPTPSTEIVRSPSTALSWDALVIAYQEQADRTVDALQQQNSLVAAGRLLSEHAPQRAIDHWRSFREAFDDGPHVEEAAFREADALRQTGRLDEARQAARQFRARFPDSPYAASTRNW